MSEHVPAMGLATLTVITIILVTIVGALVAPAIVKSAN
jgi:hypothetical protein